MRIHRVIACAATVGALGLSAMPLIAQVTLSPNNSVNLDPVARPANSFGQSTTFAVQYFAATSGLDQRFTFTCTAFGNVAIISCPAARTLTSNDPAVSITVSFSTGAAGAGWITVRADQTLPTGPLTATGRRDFTIASPAATLVVQGSGSVFRGVGAAGTETFTLTNSGALTTAYDIADPAASCSGILSGCVVAPTTTSAMAAGATQAVTASYTTAGAGVKTLTLQVTAGASVLASASTTVTVLSAAVAPASASLPVTTSGTAQPYGGFTLVNAPNSPAMTVQLTATCSGALSSCFFDTGTSSKSISLGAGAAPAIPVTFIAATAGSGTFTIAASSNGVSLGGAALTVTAQPPPVVVSLEPPNPSDTKIAGPATNTYTGFILTNEAGSPASTIQLDLTCTLLTTCQFTNGLATISIPLAVNQAAPFNVTYVAPTAGAGTARVDARVAGGQVLATRTLNVTVQGQPVATFTPLVANQTFTVGPTTRSFNGFTLTNQPGSPATTVVFTVSCAIVTSCVFSTNGLPSLSVPLAVNQAYNVPLSYVASAVGSGTVSVRAATTANVTLSQATLNVTVEPPVSVSIAPSSATTTVTASNAQRSYSGFVVTNGPGSPATTIQLTPTCSGVLSLCQFGTGSQTQSVSLAANGGTADVDLRYTAATVGTGTLTLSAALAGGPTLSTASLTVTAQPPPVVMATLLPATPSVTVTTGGSTQQYNGFTLTNAANSPAATFDLTVTCSVVTTCRFSNGLQSIQHTLVVNGTQGVPITFVAPVNGAGTVTVTVASGGSTLTSATLSVTAQPPAIVMTLTPATASVPVNVGPGPQNFTGFTLTNTPGSPSASVELSFTACSGVSGCLLNGQPTLTTTVAANGSFFVPISYVAAAPGTGTITVRAVASGVTLASATLTVTVQATGIAMVVRTQGLTTDSLLYRDECVALSLGSEIASECGDLRVVHALPAVRTLNVTRAPVMTYSSAHARSVTSVPAELTLPAGVTLTSTVTASLKIDGAQYASGFWLGTSFTPGVPRRVTLNVDNINNGTLSGVYPYVLEVTIQSTAGSFISRDSGQLIVVNRSTSEFGAGWWVSGLERLSVGNPERLVWYGGDGSVRVYNRLPTSPTGNRVWGAATASYPDSIREGPGNTYVRQLPDSVWVTFGTTGLHLTTRNSLGHVTTFTRNAQGRLQEIAVPPGPVSTALKWVFNYSAGVFPKLLSITAPGNSSARTVTWNVNPTTGRVDSIADPGTPSRTVRFTYGDRNIMNSRTNGRGVVTRFQYDSSFHVSRSSLIMPADSISRAITNWQAVGLSGVAGDPAAVSVTLSGPRLGQSTKFQINKYGAPTRVVSMVSATDSLVNTVSRLDPRFPTLVTRSVSPTGYEVNATYDVRGRLLTQSSLATSGALATTQYKWHPTWDAVEVVQNPEGDATTFGIDPASGRRLWQQDARGPSTRTTFTYDPVTQQPDSVRAPGRPPQRFGYGPLGNLSSRFDEANQTWSWLGNGIGLDTLARAPYSTVTPLSAAFETTRFVYSSRNELLTKGHGAGTISDTVQTTLDEEGNPLTVRRTWRPNPQGIADQTTTFTYDRADRPVRKCESTGGCDSTVFDSAGNAVTAITRRARVISMSYDLLGRLSERSIPSDNSYTYQATGLVTPATGPESLPFTLPTRPAEIQRYTYHASGQIETATALDADVTRSYHPSGALLGETLGIRDRTRASITNTYTMTYSYDRNGRRTARTVGPSALFAGVPMRYVYTNWGAVDTVTDVASNRFSFGYNVRGELTSTTYPGNVQQTRTYDVLGRDSTDRIVRTGPTGWPFFSSTLIRDFRVTARNGRGQIITASDASALSGAVPSVRYDSVGRLIRSRIVQSGYQNIAGATTSYVAGDTMTYDGLGNVLTTKNGWSLGSTTSSETSTSTYNTATGRLTSLSTAGSTTQHTYDAAGNTRFEMTVRTDGTRSLERASYYGSDDRLLATDRRTPGKQLLEEYRYDALGRRVWVSTRWRCAPSADTLCIANAVTRTVWDGVSEVAELRARYDTTTASTEILDSGAPLVPPAIIGDANPFYGRVVYGPGLALDQPLSVTRYEYRDNPYGGAPAQGWPTFTLVPFWDYRGTPAFGLYADGKTWLPFGSGGTACAPPGTGTATRCVNLTWPFAGSAYHQDRGLVRTLSWHGSLLLKKRDVSGLTYLRNRMYDPATGRFTQEDPIGLAGGLNAYGFAGGDPVNFSDPFGLCPGINGTLSLLDCPRGYVSLIGEMTGALIGGVVGGTGGASAGAALCAATVVGAAPCAVAGGAAGAAAGARRGAVIGGAVGAALDVALAMANAGKGRGSNQNPNDEAIRAAKDAGLNRAGRGALHDEITGQDLSAEEIREIAFRLAEQAKYLRNPPK